MTKKHEMSSDDDFSDGDELISAITLETDVEGLFCRIKSKPPTPLPADYEQRRRYANDIRAIVSKLSDVRGHLAYFVYTERKMQNSLLIQNRPPIVSIDANLCDSLKQFNAAWDAADTCGLELLDTEQIETILESVRRIATACAKSITLHANVPIIRHYTLGAASKQLRDPTNKAEHQLVAAFAAKIREKGWGGTYPERYKLPGWVVVRQLETDFRQSGWLRSGEDDCLITRRKELRAIMRVHWIRDIEPIMYRFDGIELAAEAARGIRDIEKTLEDLLKRLLSDTENESERKPAKKLRSKLDDGSTIPRAGDYATTFDMPLTKCVRTAWNAYKYVESKWNDSKPLTDKAAWEWLNENSPDAYEPVDFETFSRYVRAGRKAHGERKNNPRAGRAGRSVVDAREI